MSVIVTGLVAAIPSGNLSGKILSALVPLMITVVALQALSNLPTAIAADATEICKKICAPLPGDEKGVPERVCQEVCKKGEVVTKMRQWVGNKAGGWSSIGDTAASGAIDCAEICTGGPKALLMDLGETFWWHVRGDRVKAMKSSLITSGKAACSGISYTPLGVPGCLACCAVVKTGEYLFKK